MTNADRVAHRRELDELLEVPIAGLATAELLSHLESAGVPAAPVQNVAQVAAHPQTVALGMLQPLPHPQVPDLVTLAFPLSVDDARVVHRSPPPELGADTAAVLAEAGYSSDEIADLAIGGVVRLAV